jgi:hypothetical protein
MKIRDIKAGDLLYRERTKTKWFVVSTRVTRPKGLDFGICLFSLLNNEFYHTWEEDIDDDIFHLAKT